MNKALYDHSLSKYHSAVLTGMVTLYKALGGGWDSPDLTSARVADNGGPQGLSGGR